MEMDPLPPQSCTLSTVQRIAKNPRHFSIVYLFIVILETVFSGCQRHVIHERKEAKSNLLRAEGRRHKLDILYLDRAKQISESSSKSSALPLGAAKVIQLRTGVGERNSRKYGGWY
ncbi:hypothetical protein QQP08_023546 [Theobroma cacao]|nr:hypothetical protein QQP08_023546 [Theobroma cacao]